LRREIIHGKGKGDTMKNILHQFKISAVVLIVFSILTGIVYPLVITAISQLLFPQKANGSIVKIDGKEAGSELIGQPFNDPKYFWSRLSATSPYQYNAGASSGSNLGPVNPSLLDGIKKRMQDLKTADPQNNEPVPVDLVTASGSGLDPHISIAATMYQVPRVARLRGIGVDQLRTLVDRYTEGRQFGILGEPRVNVLQLNLALDKVHSTPKEK
jgi:K+-transporting ATPase ATPase C chain